jgi:beta-N-acetylhexosaminidase
LYNIGQNSVLLSYKITTKKAAWLNYLANLQNKFFMKLRLLAAALFLGFSTQAQITNQQKWVDSVFATLTPEQKIAQLMVVRLSERTASGVVFYEQKVIDLVKKYNIGGVCLFQGAPTAQAKHINNLQSIAKTPLLMCVDGEFGLGMRFDSILPLNRQMMLGAIEDPNIIYEYGKWVGQQCKRIGIQVNYAPVVDVNNNPLNPIINDRSFGEDKYKVAQFGIAYMKGMQDAGVMACAKHFPGHGDVTVDSHKDLPVINKTFEQLDSLELYPFKEIFKAGVGSVMIAHLSIPAIDNAANKPTSISYKNVTELMRGKLQYNGLSFTDALEMQGVKKFYPDGEASVQSIIAGNDMLCLPGDVPLAIAKIKEAIKKKRLSWDDINLHVLKVLQAKYQYGLANVQPISLANLTADLNANTAAMRKKIAENAITLLNETSANFFPIQTQVNNKIAVVAIGINTDNKFTSLIKQNYNADVFYFDYKKDAGTVLSLATLLKKKYKKVIVTVHNFARVPANNFGLSAAAIKLANELQTAETTATFVFGNAYAIKNFANAKNIVACYEDDVATQTVALEVLKGNLTPKGKLPVTVTPNLKYGTGLAKQVFFYPTQTPMMLALTPLYLTK